MKSGKRSTACQVTLQCKLKLVLTGFNSMLLPPVAALGTTTLRDFLCRLYNQYCTGFHFIKTNPALQRRGCRWLRILADFILLSRLWVSIEYVSCWSVNEVVKANPASQATPTKKLDKSNFGLVKWVGINKSPQTTSDFLPYCIRLIYLCSSLRSCF